MTPDSLEITSEVKLVFKDLVDDINLSIGATDMLSELYYKFNWFAVLFAFRQVYNQ